MTLVPLAAPSGSMAEAKPTTTAAAVPTATAIPDVEASPPKEEAKDKDDKDGKSPFPQPKLRLEVRDLVHEGADVFFQSVNAATVLSAAVANVQRLLYGQKAHVADPTTHMPPTRSVTVILRDMGGVAYTTGSELDNDHKEIHVSLGYIAGVKPRTTRAPAEITGVLTHELVHCYQWNALGTAPGGLIEGIADWVRLHCDLAPPHWKREPTADGRWDGGYQHTGYFLDYLEHRFGKGTVRRINEKLRLERYEEKEFWTELLGRPVSQLWQDYVKAVESEQ